MLDDFGKFSLPEVEERVLKFWKEKGVFGKTLAKNKSKKKFVFYEGPPTANGRPGIHHVLGRSFKDIVLRYKTMSGFFVPRRAGWDTQGLAVEIEVERKLGLKSKRDIEKFGIAEFNEKCRESVWKYKDEWERMTDRIGFWLDLKNPYITYEKDYIETLWWILSEIDKKKLLYKGHKVVPWCTRCGTALSSHELALGYRTVEDKSVYVKFKVKPKTKEWGNTSILSWTTTPWTLPGNVALAINPNHKFVCSPDPQLKGHWLVTEKRSFDRLVKTGILLPTAKDRSDIFEGKYLVGIEYEPLFSVPKLKSDKSHRVYPADFVTTGDGTGIVHTAVMYGEDDYKLGAQVGLPRHHTVNEAGIFTSDVPALAGMYVKAKETEEKIFEILKRGGNFLHTEKYEHEYPFCWRCGTPLLYYARDSWFIGMSKLKQKLLTSNRSVDWIPKSVKEGRFGEWLKDLKDWAISRERYWGTPLPVWTCVKCGRNRVVGSVEELSAYAGGSRNNYWVMRHGESETNVFNILDSGGGSFHLTPRGRSQVEKSIRKFKEELSRKHRKIDVIISSDVLRTMETDKIDLGVLGHVESKVDKRLEEIHLGNLTGCHDEKYAEEFPTYESKFTGAPAGGESVKDLRTRLWKFLKECEARYSRKNILLVSHEYPIWMLFQAAEGWSEKEAIAEKEKKGKEFITFAEIRKMNLKIVPRDGTGEIDLHKPYVDDITFRCSCGGTMKRVPEVADVWFDSGSMPFAQIHYPFDKKEKLEFPADYIVEGMDQTRGWFYTLLAVATLLGKKAPYRHVVSFGLVLDKNGQKMSKSKGNVVNPWDMIQKYGADVLRWHFYTVNPPGEPKRFDEADLGKVLRQFILMVYNSYVFYKTYADKNTKYQIPNTKYSNILDRWVLARLAEATAAVTKKLDAYDVGGAGKSIEEFVNDLSKWYIRRSRRRFQKPDNRKDYAAASTTLGHCLKELSKLLAPFTPFFAEALYLSLQRQETRSKRQESVHLADWPGVSSKPKTQNPKLLSDMKTVRDLASAALAKRAELGIKVRQPLQSLKIKNPKLKISKDLLDILKDEINVKEIIFDSRLKEEFVLDTNITPELKEEGTMRELVRMIQGLRQDGGLMPKDRIVLIIEAGPEVKNVAGRNKKLLMKEVNASEVLLKRSEKFDVELDTKFEGEPIWIGLSKT